MTLDHEDRLWICKVLYQFAETVVIALRGDGTYMRNHKDELTNLAKVEDSQP
jgi:hypothetical protein